MTRGLNPPETLSADDVHTLRAVRRDIYYNGIIGGGVGLCSGIVLYTGAQYAKKFGFLKGAKLNPNTGMLTILGSFAFGTFFMASTTGKELVHLLHPVFRAGWAEPEHNLSLPKLTNGYEATDATVNYQQQQLRELRIARKNSLNERLLKGGSGISDSHSGRWVDEKDNSTNSGSSDSGVDVQQLREMRATRKQSLTDSLLKGGRGISDSHSGRWVEENSETKFERG
eukprot:CAMPEP_0197269764 /NCGR_PEP_ID=MMETSP1432-20130617/6052_1 /TAXON_ID=44447 /ORGANISM="Pseudo-nitzschia delicatissima, Strain UNC1205" /LENGTH=226 /DNA_ID=CAMNT_0042734973 /DNA_START=125 /DNA_END=805 /DNA_ORIENTATION=+